MADETSSPADETLVTGASERTPAAVERGDLIGRYVVLSRLGAGGMGVVFAAYDPELDRKVALKLLHSDAGDNQSSAGQRRLLREAQAMARLAHPNVITVHDVGTHTGRVFVAMEFVEGSTLRTWIANERRPWLDVLDVFQRGGKGLVAAHAAGIVHRDFKPDNVMIGKDGRVRVMDFGLARPTGEREPSFASSGAKLGPNTDALGSDVTQYGSVAGTPAYMAPEQHYGRTSDARTDQFSFCVALWEGIYGERPFAGETLAELTFTVTAGKLREPPKTEVPGWVRPVLARGLAVDPAARWPTLAELLSALERGAARRRRRALAVVGGALLIGSFAAIGGWRLELERRHTTCRSDAEAIAEVWNAEAGARLRDALVGTGVAYAEGTFVRATPQLDAYVAAWRMQFLGLCEATEVDGSRAEELWEASRQCLDERRGELSALLDVLSDAPDPTAVQRTGMAIAGLAGVEPCADDVWLGPHPAGDDTGATEVRQRLWRAEALGSAGRYADGLSLARELCDETADHDSVRLRAQVLTVAGLLAEKAVAYEESRDHLRDAFGLALRAGEDDLALAAANLLVLTTGDRLAQPEQGELWGVVAQGLQARVGGEHDLGAGTLHTHLGVMYRTHGRYDEAERSHLQSLAIWEKVLGPDHPHVGMSHNNLGGVYYSQGRYAESERAQAKSRAIFEQALGPEHPSVAHAHHNLGNVYRAQGRYAEAERSYERTLTILEKVLGPDHPRVGMARGSLGNVYQAQGRLEEAGRAHAAALAVFEQAMGPDHPHVAMSHGNLGNAYQAQGRHIEAERSLERALAIFERVLGPEHANVATTYDNLGNVYLVQGRHEDAERAHVRALGIFEKVVGPDHPNVAKALVGLASAQLALGRASEAVRVAERALAIRTRAGGDQAELARARFLVARTLWAAKGDRARARTLSAQARDGLGDAGEAHAQALEDVEAWLAKHGGHE